MSSGRQINVSCDSLMGRQRVGPAYKDAFAYIILLGNYGEIEWLRMHPRKAMVGLSRFDGLASIAGNAWYGWPPK